MHLVHRLQQAQDEAERKEMDIEQIKEQVLKLQLGEARQKVNDEKKEDKTPKVMVAQCHQESGWPDSDPNLYPANTWGTARRPNWGGRVAIRGYWGSRGGQQGGGGDMGRRRGAHRGGQPGNECFICCQPGHWAQECPLQQQQQPQPCYTSQPVTRGRGSHPAPNLQMAPPGQYPGADWGWQEDRQ